VILKQFSTVMAVVLNPFGRIEPNQFVQKGVQNGGRDMAWRTL